MKGSVGEMVNVYGYLFVDFEGKVLLGIPIRKWEDYIKMGLKNVLHDGEIVFMETWEFIGYPAVLLEFQARTCRRDGVTEMMMMTMMTTIKKKKRMMIIKRI